MNYRESLNKARENGIRVLTLEVADEMEYQLDNTYHFFNEDLEDEPIIFDNEAFENLCSLCEEAYLKSDNLSVYECATATVKLFIEKDGINFDRYDIINKACY